MPPWGIALFYGFRLLVVAYMFFGIGYSPFDIHGWYEHAGRMLHGEMAGRDFMSPYGALFNLLLLFSVKVWNNPFSMVVMFSLIELAGVFVLRSALLTHHDVKNSSAVLWLYMTCPFVFREIGYNMQDEGILMALMAVMYWLYVKGKDWLLPLVAVAGILATKILAIAYIAPIFVAIHLKHSVRFVVLLLCAFGLLALGGINPFCVSFERVSGSADAIARQITPGNPWYLLKNVLGDAIHPTAQIVYAIALVLVLLAIFCAIERRNEQANDKVLIAALSSIGIISVTIDKMSYVCYLAPMLPFLFMLLVADGCLNDVRRHGLGVMLFLWYCATSHSILRKLVGFDHYAVVNSILFPLCGAVVWAVIVHGAELRFPIPSILVARLKARILGMDKKFK